MIPYISTDNIVWLLQMQKSNALMGKKKNLHMCAVNSAEWGQKQLVFQAGNAELIRYKAE